MMLKQRLAKRTFKYLWYVLLLLLHSHKIVGTFSNEIKNNQNFCHINAMTVLPSWQHSRTHGSMKLS